MAPRTGAAGAVDALRRASRLGDEHEGVAADPGHVRVDHGDRRGGGDHRLDRVAAGAKHLGARLGRRPMRGGDHALLADDGLRHHGGPGQAFTFFRQLYFGL